MKNITATESVDFTEEVAPLFGELCKKLAARKGIYNKVNDPASIELCYKLGLNYDSCSPFRVPAAKLAGVQAVIKANK